MACRNPRSHVIESASRWLVGSSSSSVVSDGPAAVGGAEQDAGEFDAPALAAGQRAQRLVEDAVGQAEVVADRRRLALGGIPAERGEPVLEVAVLAHRLVALGVVDDSAIAVCCFSSRASACRGRAPRARGRAEHIEIALARVLRQVADVAAAVDLARVRLGAPASMRMVVVLPAPLRPTSPMRSPGWIRRWLPGAVTRVRTPARTSRSVAVITLWFPARSGLLEVDG